MVPDVTWPISSPSVVASFVTVAGYAALDHLEAYEFASDALGLLPCEQVAVDEILTLGELGHPA